MLLRLLPRFRLGTSLVRTTHSLSLSNDKKSAQWNRAISRAEKIVGVPNTNFTWDVLTSDSGVGAATYLRKLLGTSHPIIKTIKGLIHNGKNNLQTRGIVMLLLSRCAGHIEGSPQLFQGEWEEAVVDGITKRQRNMAEIVEMVYASHLIHRDVVNISKQLIKDEVLLSEIQYGNKIAILVGDILISNASKKTAELNECKVLDLIAGAIGDFMKSEFVVRHDSYGQSFPLQGMSRAHWEKRTFFSNGSLLANACQSSVLMAGHGDSAQTKAKEFGMSLGFAWQLQYELQPFVDLMFQAPAAPFDLTSLPAVLYFEQNRHIIQNLESCLEDLGRVDYADLYEQISKSGCVEQAMDMLQLYVDTALGRLEGFDACYRSKQALADIILALK